MSQSVKGVRGALFALCQTLYASEAGSDGKPTLVCYGKPGKYQPGQIVAVMGARRPITQPTMGGSQRSRRTEAEFFVVFSVYVPGREEQAQVVASDACDDLIDLLESYFRTSPGETLGGACREALVTNVDGPEPDVIGSKSGAVAGCSATAVVTVTARIDY